MNRPVHCGGHVEVHYFSEAHFKSDFSKIVFENISQHYIIENQSLNLKCFPLTL